MDQDIRSGFDFTAAEKGDYRSANPALRAAWAFWRRTAKLYRFGRTELLPVRSNAEGIGKYVGKYLAKHMGARKDEDKGARLVRYAHAARAGSTRFAWAGRKGWLWRAKLARWAERHGFKDQTALRQQFGPKWAYRIAQSVAAEVLESYPTMEHARADGVESLSAELVVAAGHLDVSATISEDGEILRRIQYERSGAVTVKRARLVVDSSGLERRPSLAGVAVRPSVKLKPRRVWLAGGDGAEERAIDWPKA